RLMDDQRERSRAGGMGARAGDALAERIQAVAKESVPSEFVGWEHLQVDTDVLAVEPLDGDEVLVKLERSPFYAEGGGQVSDTGTIAGHDGQGTVLGVHRVGDDQVLRVRIDRGSLPLGEEVTAQVDAPRRRLTQANHTATHVLNWALRTTLGDGVRQAGSYVGPDKLRFDFTHRGRIPAEELAAIERLVNERVLEDAPVTWEIVGRAEASERGAIGLFEEKYGERVRVVSTGDFSQELCGGAHVGRTGEIGPFVIAGEGSTGAGARRIEAVTGPAAADLLREREARLRADLDQREERIRTLEAELKRARTSTVDVAGVAATAETLGAVRLVAARVDAPDMDELLAISDRVKAAVGASAAIVLGGAADGKAMLVANLAEEAVAAGLKAGELIREIAPIVDGGGGGKDQMARAGGKDPARLDDALGRARAVVTERMAG
ncbi:MAG: DHHA1 domain-containing protein, partial [Miltoncostaeaceae bacterium]